MRLGTLRVLPLLAHAFLDLMHKRYGAATIRCRVQIGRFRFRVPRCSGTDLGGCPRLPQPILNREPGTRRNSRTLFVTSTTPSDSACAAIRVSSGPTGFPDDSSFARTARSRHKLAHRMGDSSASRNSDKADRACSDRLLFAAPYWSSATVIAETPTCRWTCRAAGE